VFGILWRLVETELLLAIVRGLCLLGVTVGNDLHLQNVTEVHALFCSVLMLFVGYLVKPLRLLNVWSSCQQLEKEPTSFEVRHTEGKLDHKFQSSSGSSRSRVPTCVLRASVLLFGV
jgi:hypothetical protein